MSADSLSYDLLVAFALVLVLEGLIYALFPDTIKRMMVVALSFPASRLRAFGLWVMAAGVLLAWALQQVY